MPAKSCIPLALVLLFLALASGNPFLERRGLPAPALPMAVPLVTSVSHGGATPECPDVSLRDLVVAVRFDAAGEPVWTLQDGRSVRRNPAFDPRDVNGQPMLLFDVPGASRGD